MAGDSPAPSDRSAWRPWLLTGVFLCILFSIITALRAERSSDFRDFWRTALNFRTTGELSSELGVHNYLPVFPILCTPISLLPLQVSIVLFTIVSVAALGWSVWRLTQLLEMRADDRALLTGFLLMMPYIWSCLTLGAFGLVLLALTVEALHALQRRADVRAGLLLGLATLLKLLPGALFVYCLWRGRWKACLGGGLLLGVLGLGLPTLLLGYEESVGQHQRFYAEAVQGHSAYTTIHAEKPIKANYSNNAVPMVLRRLLSPVDGSKRHEHEDGWTVNVADLASGTIWGIFVGVLVLILGLSLWSGRWGTDLLRGYAVFSCVMLLASPLVWTHYLPLAFLPLLWLCQRAWRGDRIALCACVAWGVGAVCLAIPQARASGAQIGSVVAVWLGLLLVRPSRATSALP